MKSILNTTLLLVFFKIGLLAQSNLLLAGPMLGYVEHREVLIWLEVSSDAKEVTIAYWPTDAPNARRQKSMRTDANANYHPLKFVLEDLNMNTNYQYEIMVNGQKTSSAFPLQFKTKLLWEWRQDAPDFSFLLGSCAYINDTIYDRPGRPYGQGNDIFEVMANESSDLMIWGGDNVYLREADYSSASGIRYRYSYNFKQPYLQKLRATRANYAIWDDHDGGPNDTDRSYELQPVARQTFAQYWGHKTFGDGTKGVYHTFQWSDCQFLMLDNRSFRAPNGVKDSLNGQPNAAKEYLGKQQMQWLKDQLLDSYATFKFIVVGSQTLNPLNTKECFQEYPAEYLDLMAFIKQYRITGVVFLSGDRHFSELIKIDREGTYPLYDFTCSPLSSGVYKDVATSAEGNNPYRVEGSLLAENNFGKISISGKKKERVLQLATYDITGKQRWSFQIKEGDLK